MFWVFLGFLLPPCAFCGLPILLFWGRVKGWDGYAGDVRFSESFCHLGLWGRIAVFDCWHSSMQVPFQPQPQKMSANKGAASSSASGQSGKDASGDIHAEKSVDKLNVKEFCERFCIPNGVSVETYGRKCHVD